MAPGEDEPRLTHLDDAGRARMVDVTEKPETERWARAEGFVAASAATLDLIEQGGLPKGDVLAAARIAGIMAAKRTAELIPLCHPLAITAAEVRFERAAADRLRIEASVRTAGQTGVEMEALTAVAVAALTVYDMCKAVERGMRIDGIRLLEKAGGRSGHWRASERSADPA